MKKRELFELKRAIIDCGNLQGAKFAYALGKNLDKVNNEIKIIEAARQKPSKKLEEFSKKELQLVQKFAKKDKEGEFIPSAEGDYIILNKDLFDVAINELKSQYIDEINESENIRKDFETLLDEEIEIDFFKIKFEIVPDAITSKQLNGIFNLIENV